MRPTLLLSAFGLAALGTAQTNLVTGSEQLIKEAYANQRLNDGLVLEMRGIDANGSIATPIHAILYWRLSYDPRTRLNSGARAELDIYQGTATGESLWMRLVGDGTTLYRYDIGRREVSTSLYGFYGTTPPGGYSGSDAPKLLAQLHTATPGLTAYLVRLLDELNPAGANYPERYTNWLPGHAAQIFDTVPLPIRQMATVRQADTVRDPITGRMFVRGDPSANEWVFEGMERRDTERTVTFHMVPDPVNGDQWVVQTVNVALRSPTGRVVDLTMVPNTGIAPRWAFVPYTGAQGAAFRPIAGGL